MLQYAVRWDAFYAAPGSARGRRNRRSSSHDYMRRGHANHNAKKPRGAKHAEDRASRKLSTARAAGGWEPPGAKRAPKLGTAASHTWLSARRGSACRKRGAASAQAALPAQARKRARRAQTRARALRACAAPPEHSSAPAATARMSLGWGALDCLRRGWCLLEALPGSCARKLLDPVQAAAPTGESTHHQARARTQKRRATRACLRLHICR